MRLTPILCFTLLVSLGESGPLAAWDSVGHRLSAAVALEFVDEQTREKLIEILSAHPRWQQDFLAAIPDFVDQSNTQALNQWLLGQAAYWPDIARGLPDDERRRYNRPSWHYTDGAWMRGATQVQGNVYVDLTPFADIPGELAARIDSEDDVSNVVTAIDYNTRLLFDSSVSAPDRAVALCWVLHLIGDIHQPLHAGSLFSPVTFETGDRGGNGIPIEDRNLHARWDSALAGGGVARELEPVVEFVNSETAGSPQELDWTIWLNESREVLHSHVYSRNILAEIRSADANRREMNPLTLTTDYVNQMQSIARQRLGLAGYRLALLFESRLPD